MQPAVSSVVKGISRRGIRRARRRYVNKHFSFAWSLKQIKITEYFNYILYLMAFFEWIICPEKKMDPIW